MKDVISYRTPHLDDLKKIAKIRNVSLSTITGEIIQDYLNNYILRKNYDMFFSFKSLRKVVFDYLDPSVFDKIVRIATNEQIRCLKMTMNHFSLDNLLSSFKEWMEINNYKFHEFDENERIRLVCETRMGGNFNEITGKYFKNVFENFGFSSNLESNTVESFEIVIIKNSRL